VKILLDFKKRAKKFLDSPPDSLHFLMNDYCNCACVFCNQDFSQSSKKDITLEKFKEIISNLAIDRVKNFHFSGGGEPLLSKDIFPIIEYVNANYPKINVSIRTNGLLIHKYASIMADLNVASLEVSIHGLAQENDFILQRKDATDTVFKGIALLNDLLKEKNKKISKAFCCVVSMTNIHVLEGLIKKAAELKVEKLNVEFCRYFPHQAGPKLAEKDSLYFHQNIYNRTILISHVIAWWKGIKLKHDPLFGKPPKKFSCSMPWDVMLIGPDGDVFPCCGGEAWFNDQVKSSKYYFGNLLKEPLLTFWNKGTYSALRKGLASPCNEGLLPECKSCHRSIYTLGPDRKEGHIFK